MTQAVRDGATHLVMTPLEFMQRLEALVPALASHTHSWGAAQNPTDPLADHASAHSAPARMSWARSLKRVFAKSRRFRRYRY
jgi:hypothetical protein